MKFLWVSNAPWTASGYGNQTRLILKALKEMGHEPTCFCLYGLDGGMVEYDGYRCLPTSPSDHFGNDVLARHAVNCGAEAIVTLADAFLFNPQVWRPWVKWLAWLPIDCEKIGPQALNAIASADVKIPMSEFGKKELEDNGFVANDVIYHAVDTSIFTPRDKETCRKELGLFTRDFIIGIVASNQPGNRKLLPTQLLAIKTWIQQYERKNISVYIHSEATDVFGGWDLRLIVNKLGLSKNVLFSDPYQTSVVPLNAMDMATIYGAMDVLLNVTAGEGLGIPILEAQACGIPVITHDVTAMSEITINGWAVKPQSMFLAPNYGYWFMPNMDDFVDKIERVYQDKGERFLVNGRRWVVNNYSLPVIAQKWDKVLRENASR